MIPDPDDNTHTADELLRRAAWTWRLARGLLGDDALADDVAQDVWLAASQRPPRATEAVEPWLRTVIRNRVFNLTRERKRRQARERSVDAPEPAESAEAALARLELHKLLVDVVGKLAEPYRQIILLRYFDGLTSAEIGARTNLPPGTVRGRLKTGLELLRETLDRRLGGRAQWTLTLGELCPPRSGADPGQPSRAPGPLVQQSGRLLGAASLAGAAAIAWWLTGAPWAARHQPAATASDDVSAGAASNAFAGPTYEGPRPPALGHPAPAAAPPSKTAASAVGQAAPLTGRVTASGDLAKLAAPRVGRGGGLVGAVVRVSKGVSGAFPVPAGEVQLSLRGSALHPRAQVGRIGQAIVVENDDDAVHSIRVRQGVAVLFQGSIPPSSRSARVAIPDSLEAIRIDCPAHPLESALVVPADNPFHAVTGEDGRFVLADLRPGVYTLEASDETLGTRTANVSGSSGSPPIAIDFSDGSIGASLRDGSCRIATSGRGPVAEACRAGGVAAAKKVMKGLLKQAKVRGERLACDGCHQDLDDYRLLDGAREKLAELTGLAGGR